MYCQSCSSGFDDQGQLKCPYCGSSLIVETDHPEPVPDIPEDIPQKGDYEGTTVYQRVRQEVERRQAEREWKPGNQYSTPGLSGA